MDHRGEKAAFRFLESYHVVNCYYFVSVCFENNIKAHSGAETTSETLFQGIVHFGVGNFCRAHLFEYTHHFNNQTVGSESDNEPWLIHGIGVIDNDYEKESFEKIKSSNFFVWPFDFAIEPV